MTYWTTALLGSTNKFFMPWLVPRNDKGSVYAPSFLGKLFGAGRKRRDVTDHENNVLTSEFIFSIYLIFNLVKIHSVYGASRDSNPRPLESSSLTIRPWHLAFLLFLTILQMECCIVVKIGFKNVNF